MKISNSLPSIALFTLSLSACALSAAGQQNTDLRQQRKKDDAALQKKARLQAIWEHERDFNYRAKLNNGSHRASLVMEDIPGELREQCQNVTKQYTEQIYPLLKKYVQEHGGLLPAHSGLIPALAPFTQDKEYQGIGAPMTGRGSWSIGFNFRLDGTMVSRDVYSSAPPDRPHDVWAEYVGFIDIPESNKGLLISGWDDGRVTISKWEEIYFGNRKSPTGLWGGHAVPGQAGIPTDTIRTMEKWLRRNDSPQIAAAINK